MKVRKQFGQLGACVEGWLSTRRAALAMLGAAGVAAVMPKAQAQAKVTLRVSTWGASKAPQVSAFVGPFQSLVETASNGAITIQNFPDGSLVNERAVPSAVQSNVVDISLTTMGSWASIAPEAGVLNTIFFKPTADNFEKAIGPGTALFNLLDAGMSKHGVKMLCVLYNGPLVLVSHLPFTTPQSFQGKAVRVFDKLTASIVQTLGGAPSTIEVADVYPALERGTVAGAIGGLEGAIGLKEYEVAKNVLATNGVFGLLITGYVMNAAKFNSLSPDLQKVLIDSAYKAGTQANAAMVAAYAEGLDKMRQHGMTVTVLEPGSAAYQAFTQALAPLAKTQEAAFDPQLVAQVIAAQT